ncbi:MAG: hypothetical protein V3V49_13995, partial [Candidatus Krumholzibacteria bacterium]
MGRLLILPLALTFAWIQSPASAKKPPAHKNPVNYRFMSSPQRAVLPAELQPLARGPSLSTAAATDTFHLGWYSFDTGGAPDLQGWVSVDRTVPVDTFFHVADSTELDGGQLGSMRPLQGSQSMWCGVARSIANPFSGYATLPGYGNDWKQRLQSVTFPVTGDVVVSYKVQWDAEPEYDGTTFEYSGDGGSTWALLPVGGGLSTRPNIYDGTGALTETFVIDAASLGGNVTLRFVFESDGAWSDEDGLWPTDGAIIIDSLVISDASGIVNEQDFEAESPGDRTTADGAWFGTVPIPYGTFAALYPGTTILQEDPCFLNATHFWGWFDDPTRTNYNCHLPDPRPDVGAFPYGPTDGQYLNNEIWSPWIAYTGAGDEVRLEFRVYRDMPLDNLQFYTWSVRSRVGGSVGTWNNDNFVYFGGQKDWVRPSFSIGAHIDSGATDIQIAIGARDMCEVWCGIFGFGFCHSHAPLVDDGHIMRVNVVGPQFAVRHIDLFQDNFAADGTLTGPARADAAGDIASHASPTIRPGDSITVNVIDTQVGLVSDPFTGAGPSVYAYVTVLPPGQPGKSGPELEAPESRTIGKRYPLVDSLLVGGTTWYRLRMDTVRTGTGEIVADRYAFDLNDNVFTPGDTVLYFLSGMNASSNQNYWSRRLGGQGSDFVTDDLVEAAGSPMEFTILPAGGVARGGEILYVDDTDDRGGPAQLFFDTAFDYLQLRDRIDRYDVLGPSSGVNNSLGARVQNVATQIMGPYRTIIWNTGNLSSTLINDGGVLSGGGSADKSPDFALLFQFLDTHPDNPGF